MANKEIAELTAASTLDGTELVHIVQGASSRRTTTGGIATVGLLDEDDFASDSATKAPSQQSTKAYIDSAIPAKLNASGGAPLFACRGWVNFNGTGTVAIRASGNVSSITDNGTGIFTINLINPTVDADYAVIATRSGNIIAQDSRMTTAPYGVAPTTSAVRIACTTTAGAFEDPLHANVAIFR
jgi:hypothetical protein